MKIRPLLMLLLLLFASGGEAVLVADNIVSFMHILYSTIPVIRKGTDSRLGFGFRFGPHADAQVVLELGPQRRTEPLTVITTQPPTVYDTKRHVSLDHDDGLLLHDERPVDEVVDNHLYEHRGRALQLGGGGAVGDATGGGGGEWLSRWRAGWSAPTASAAPVAAVAPVARSQTYVPQRTGRGMRIALAPTSTSTVRAAAVTSTSTHPSTRVQQPKSSSARTDGPSSQRSARAHGPAAASVRTSSSSTVLTTASPPTAHLRSAMAALSSRAPTRTSPTAAPAPAPRQPRQGIILQVLRQLWQAGTRSVRT